MPYELTTDQSQYPEAARIEGDSFTVRVMYDEDYQPEWVRDYSTVGLMLCAHPSYQLGDVQAPQPFDPSVTCPDCEGNGYATDDEDDDTECQRCEGTGEIDLGMYEYLRREYGATVVLPLFLLDHSGLAMRAGANLGSTTSTGRFIGDEAGWDTSHVGFIFDTAQKREETGVDPDRIEDALRAEVEEYDNYLQGSVYYVVAEDDDGTIIESCGGYIGESAAEECAKEFAETAEEYVERERIEAAVWEARDLMTVAA